MTSTYQAEYTDTFGGEANYSWVTRREFAMPELTHYGYTGSADGSYAKANKVWQRELMRRAKAAVGLTGARGRTEHHGDMAEFRPYGSATILFVNYVDA